MDAPHESALSVIKDYEGYLEFLLDCSDIDLQTISYEKWAVSEMINRITTNQNTPPLLVLEIFRDEMQSYSRLNKKTSFIFLIANSSAENVISELISQ